IALRTDADVATARLTLNDIADLAAPDLATLRRLMALPLGSAPHAGETFTLPRAAVAQRLASMAGMADNVEWAGASTVRVARSVHFVSGMAIQQSARAAVLAALSTAGVPEQQVMLGMSVEPMDVRLEGVRADG